MKKILTVCFIICAFLVAQNTLFGQAADVVCAPPSTVTDIVDPMQATACSDNSDAITFGPASGSLPDADYVIEVNGVITDINADGAIDATTLAIDDQVCITAFTYDLAAINGVLTFANSLCPGLDAIVGLPVCAPIADLINGVNDGVPGLNDLQEALDFAGSFGTPITDVVTATTTLDALNDQLSLLGQMVCYATTAAVCYDIVDCAPVCTLMAPACNACTAPDVSSTIDLTTGTPIQATNGGTAIYDPAATSGTVGIPANTPDLFAAIGVGELCIPDPANDICLVADIDVISGSFPFTLEFRIENGTGAPGNGGEALTFNATIDGPGACSIGGNLADGMAVIGAAPDPDGIFDFNPANTGIVIAIESFSGPFAEDVEVNINSITLTVCSPDAVVFGCTDMTADNFDPAATCDDGGCIFTGPCTLMSGACNACGACEVSTMIDFTTGGETFNDAGEFSGGTPAVAPTYDPVTNTGTFILPAGSDEIFTVGGVRDLALPDDVTDICYTADINVISGTPPISIEFRIENAANGGEQIGWNASVDGDGMCTIGGSLADGMPVGGWPGFTNGGLYTIVFAVVYFGPDPPLTQQVEIEISNWSLSVCSPSEASASTISTTDPTTICIDGVGDPIDVAVDVDGGATSAWVITDAAGTILALPPAPPFDLDGAGAGQCLIWLVNYDDPAFAPAVGDDAAAIVAASSCAFLSNPITVDRIEVTAPAISTTDPTTICVDGIGDPIDVTTDDAGIGANSAWVITDAAGIILDLPAGPPFDLDGAGPGQCLIWLVNFDDPNFAPAVGDDAAALVADATCAALSNPITVDRIEITAPVISTTDPTTICADDGIPDPITVTIDDAGTGGTTTAWVITDGAGIILALPPGLTFDLEGAGGGTCLIWLVSTNDPAFAPAVGDDAAAAVGAATCATLSNPISVIRQTDCAACTASASTISTSDPTRICVDGVGDPINVDFDVAGMGDGAWVITDAAGIILALPPMPPFDLDGAGAGQCLIWYVNVDDDSFAPAVGDDAAAAVAASSCAFLSNPITVDRIEVTAPAISTTDPTDICADDGIDDLITPTVDAAGIGANSAWVITDAAGIILALPPAPPFNLEGAGAGTCLIWLVNFDDPNFAPAVGDDAAAAVAGATCAVLSNSIAVNRSIDCGVCEGDVAYNVTAFGCDMTGASIELFDAAGMSLGTMALGPDGGSGSFGIQPCGDYSLVINNAPACYTNAGGDVGPRMFAISATGGGTQNFTLISAEIPTVGEWGLIILGLLMSITAVVGIRQRREEEVYG